MSAPGPKGKLGCPDWHGFWSTREGGPGPPMFVGNPPTRQRGNGPRACWTRRACAAPPPGVDCGDQPAIYPRCRPGKLGASRSSARGTASAACRARSCPVGPSDLALPSETREARRQFGRGEGGGAVVVPSSAPRGYSWSLNGRSFGGAGRRLTWPAGRGAGRQQTGQHARVHPVVKPKCTCARERGRRARGAGRPTVQPDEDVKTWPGPTSCRHCRQTAPTRRP